MLLLRNYMFIASCLGAAISANNECQTGQCAGSGHVRRMDAVSNEPFFMPIEGSREFKRRSRRQCHKPYTTTTMTAVKTTCSSTGTSTTSEGAVSTPDETTTASAGTTSAGDTTTNGITSASSTNSPVSETTTDTSTISDVTTITQSATVTTDSITLTSSDSATIGITITTTDTTSDITTEPTTSIRTSVTTIETTTSTTSDDTTIIETTATSASETIIQSTTTTTLETITTTTPDTSTVSTTTTADFTTTTDTTTTTEPPTTTTMVTTTTTICSSGIGSAAYTATMGEFFARGIVPTLIPSFDPKVEVNVNYNGKEVEIGTPFSITETLNQPELTFTNEDNINIDAESTTYSYFLVDPDVPNPDAGIARQTYLHWSVSGAKGSCARSLATNQQTVVLYQPLTPASVQRHRYTFLVYREPPGYVPDIVTPQIRLGFDVNSYAASAGLVLVGGNYLLAGFLPP